MTRARVSFVLLSVLLWHIVASGFLNLLPAPLAYGEVIAAAQEEGNSAWVPNAIHTAELVKAIRDNHLRVRISRRPISMFERLTPMQEPRRVVRMHRSPYPTRQQLRLRLSRSESGELPH